VSFQCSALDIQACMGREIPMSVPSDPKLTVRSGNSELMCGQWNWVAAYYVSRHLFGKLLTHHRFLDDTMLATPEIHQNSLRNCKLLDDKFC
jgi:hypothetical protein